jgi:hypothetical protein
MLAVYSLLSVVCENLMKKQIANETVLLAFQPRGFLEHLMTLGFLPALLP